MKDTPQKRRPVVGETLYSLNVGNDASRHRPQVLTPVQVIQVGRKYFYCCRPEDIKSEHRHRKYALDTWQQDNGGYCASSELFETEQEWLDRKESSHLRETIRVAFQYAASSARALSLDQLRRINAIMEEK